MLIAFDEKYQPNNDTLHWAMDGVRIELDSNLLQFDWINAHSLPDDPDVEFPANHITVDNLD